MGECLSQDADNLPSAVYLSPVETPSTSHDGRFCVCVWSQTSSDFWLCLLETTVGGDVNGIAVLTFAFFYLESDKLRFLAVPAQSASDAYLALVSQCISAFRKRVI